MTSTETPARWIAKSEHKGRTSRLLRNAPASVFTARELAALITAGKLPTASTGETCLWVSMGSHSDGSGRELFARSRVVAQPDGSLALYNHEGPITLVYPAGRRLRVLVG